MSLTIFTENNVNRNWHSLMIPAISFLALNPFFVITCGPLASKLWIFLSNKNLNPSTPTKFALGTIFAGLGFAILPLAITLQPIQIGLWWIVLSYFLQSLGELLVYPVGLSMMTELSPKKMMGLMIGVWYFATAIGNLLAGVASSLTVSNSDTSLPLLTNYKTVFNTLGLSAIALGIILLCLVKPIRRLMDGNFKLNIELTNFQKI